MLLMVLAVVLMSWSLRAQVTIPYTMDFEDQTAFSAWTMSNCESGTGLDSYAAHAGLYGFMFEYTTNYPQYLISPQFVASSNPLQVEFYYTNNSTYYVETFHVGYSTTTNDVTAFTWGPEISVGNGGTWLQYTGTIPAGAKYIAIKCTSNDQYYLYIDDITIANPPTCIAPSSPQVLSITPNSADIFWTSNGTETEWEVMVNNVSEFAYDTTHTLYNLTPETNYTVKVRAICSVGDTSAWSPTLNLYTGYCQPSPSSVDNSGITNVTFGVGTEVVNNSPANSNNVYYGNYSTQVGAVPAGTNANVDITYGTGYTYGTLIWVDWNNNMVFDDNEVVYTGTSTNSNPTTLNASFMVPATQDTGLYRMRIGGADSYFDSYISGDTTAAHNPCASSTYMVFHDYTLHVIDAPSCFPVTNLVVDSTTSSSVFLSWTDANNTGATYTIYNMDDNSMVVSGLSANTYEVTNLAGNTPYTFGVAADCGGGDLSFFSSVSGRTQCGMVSTLPYSCGFESNEIPTSGSYLMPYCWSKYNDATGTSNYYPYSYNSYARTGSRSLYFYCSTTTSYADTMMAVLPQVDVTAYPMNGNQLSFWMRTSTSSYTYNVLVGTLSDPTDPSTFVADATIPVTGTTYNRYDVNLTNAPSTNSYAAILVPRATNSGSVYIDDIVLQEIPSCFYVTNLTVDSATSNSLFLSWTDANNTGATYTIYNMADSSVVASYVSDNNYEVTNLNPNTVYSIGVVADCGGGDLAEMTVVSGRTDCGIMNVPYTEGFEGMTTGAAPNCWTHLTPVSTSDNYFAVVSSTVHTGSNALRFNYGNPAGNYAVLPEFNEQTDNLRIRFWHRAESATAAGCGVLEIGYMTNPADTSSFVVLDTLPQVATYTEATISFDNAPSTARIAFRHRAVTTNWYWNIDDVVVELQPVCPDVTGLAVDVVTPNSVTFHWNGTTADYYETVILSANNSVVATDMVYSDTTGTFSNLTPETSYSIMVRGMCSGDSSYWSQPVAVYTGYCHPAPTSVDGSGISNVTFGNAPEVVNNNQHPTSSPYYGNYSSQVGAVPAGTVANVSITYATGYTYGTLIWVDWNNNMVFDDNEVVYTGTSTNSNPTTLNASFMVPATQDTGLYRMRIGGADSYFDSYISGSATAAHDPCASSTYMVFHDYTLHVTEAPSCLAVTNLAVGAATDNSITLVWSDDLNIGATYTVYDMSDSSVLASGITDTTFTVTSLTSNMGYTFAVETDCGGGDLSGIVTVTAHTECGIQTIPFTEGFENGIDCWTLNNCDSYTGVNTSAANTGSYGFRFYYTSDYPQYLISPQFAAATTPLQLEFDYGSNSTYYMETFKVGYSTTTNDVTAFTWGNEISITGSSNWMHYSDLIPAGAKYIAIQCTSDDQYYLYIDNISIDVPPTCIPVTNLTVSATTASSITLTWTDANNTGATYNIYDMANASTPIAQNVSGTTYTVTGLTSSTNYNFGVEVDCGGGDHSTMVTVSASTECDAVATFPYTEGFESGLGCWQAVDNDNDGRDWTSPIDFQQGTGPEAHTGSGCAGSFSWSNSALTPDNYLISPKFVFPASSTITLSWFFKVNASYPADKYSVYVATGNSVADFTTPLFTIVPDSTHGDWTQQTIDLSAYAGQQVYVAFRHYDCTDMNYVLLDDITITAVGGTPQPDTCLAPSNLTATGMTKNSVVLNWTENGDATSWTVNYKEDNASNWSTTTVSSKPYTLTGLQPGTNYLVYVVANCADGQSDPSTTVTFATLADGIADYELATSLYPNPNNGQFTINNEQFTINSVNVYDVYGKLLKTVEVNSNTAVIDAHELSAGMYFVRISTEKGVVTKSFVKK